MSAVAHQSYQNQPILMSNLLYLAERNTTPDLSSPKVISHSDLKLKIKKNAGTFVHVYFFSKFIVQCNIFEIHVLADDCVYMHMYQRHCMVFHPHLKKAEKEI